jgi:N,N'-diacetylchitobiose phosphorylase
VWAQANLETLDRNLREHGWDGDWYLRAYRRRWFRVRHARQAGGQIFLNPQSWSLLSGHADAGRAATAMHAVAERLATDYGLMICDPPYVETDYNVMRAALFNPGMKENGSYLHSHARMGRDGGDYARPRRPGLAGISGPTLPGAWNTRAEVREIEPYVYCQFTHSKASPRFGASRVPWLSGSAAWSFFAATQYILGLRPEYSGLSIDPCIPSAWKEFKITRVFRGKKLTVEVRNPAGVQKGVKKLVFNGKLLEGNFIPAEQLLAENQVEVEMG